MNFYSSQRLRSLSTGYSSREDFIPYSDKIDNVHENIFAVILKAVKTLCENKTKCLYGSLSLAGKRDIE